jgi:hypothetical protein
VRTYLKQLLTLVATKLRHEPVAVWGVVLAAAIGILRGAGVDANVVDTITAVATLVGIPVVRRKVTPAAALKALLAGKPRG